MMQSYIRILVYITLIIGMIGCSTWMEPTVTSESRPVIFPDYSEVTIPSNIAPLNFMVEDAGRIQVKFSYVGEEVLKVSGKDGVINIPIKAWEECLEKAEGGDVDVQVSVWNEQYPEGVAYQSFPIHVAKDKIDPWIAYRLIEPGYRGWRQLGIYQRELTSFDESVIISNSSSNESCINCHHFPDYSSESMMLHVRGANGRTLLYHDGGLKEIKFNEIGPKKNTTYPAWHPEGRYIAFSSNTTRQIFFVHGKKPIEVYDTASDLVLYDRMTGEVLTDERFMTEDVLETFPTWSPDGKYLYFVSAGSRNLPEEIESLHYDIKRVAFDASKGTFGDEIENVYDSSLNGRSASWPRISANGQYLLFTATDYGTFPIWHDEADLEMIDLSTNELVDVSVWNDSENADSYHSWSSNGKWIIYGSRRLDGRYTRLYIAYLGEDGKPSKPFLLPQEDPRGNMWRLKSYNIPEFIDSKVEFPKVKQL